MAEAQVEDARMLTDDGSGDRRCSQGSLKQQEEQDCLITDEKGSLRLEIPLSTFARCHNLNKGQVMTVKGIGLKQGSEEKQNISVRVDKGDHMVALTLAANAMGPIFLERLSDVWKCTLAESRPTLSLGNTPQSRRQSLRVEKKVEKSSPLPSRTSTRLQKQTQNSPLANKPGPKSSKIAQVAKQTPSKANQTPSRANQTPSKGNPQLTEAVKKLLSSDPKGKKQALSEVVATVIKKEPDHTGETNRLGKKATPVRMDHVGNKAVPESWNEPGHDTDSDSGGADDFSDNDDNDSDFSPEKSSLSQPPSQNASPVKNTSPAKTSKATPTKRSRESGDSSDSEHEQEQMQGLLDSIIADVKYRSIQDAAIDSRDINKEDFTNEGPKYFCFYCDEGFTLSSDRTIHQKQCETKPRVPLALNRRKRNTTPKTNTNNELYVCRFCEKAFEHRSSRILHEQSSCQVIATQRKLTCFCWKEFETEEALTDHKETCPVKEVDRKYPCEHCPMSFGTTQERVQHAKAEHKDLHIMCRLCHTEFSSKSRLKLHMLMKHHEGEEDRPGLTTEGIVLQLCNFCTASFVSKGKLICHMFKQHPNEEIPVDLLVKSDSKNYQCKFCDMVFSNGATRQQHQVYRCPDNPEATKAHHCKQCNRIFTTKEILKNHIKEVHQKCTSYVCHICGIELKSRSSIYFHKLRKHSAEPPKFPCPHCDKAYHARGKLRKHMSVHSDDRSIQCQYCGKQFKNKEQMSQHVKTVHEGRYRYRCDKCGHGMEKKQYLQSHKCGRVRRIQDSDVAPTAAGRTGEQDMSASEGHDEGQHAVSILQSTVDPSGVILSTEGVDTAMYEHQVGAVTTVTSGIPGYILAPYQGQGHHVQLPGHGTGVVVTEAVLEQWPWQ